MVQLLGVAIGIIAVFIIIGTALPFIQRDFGSDIITTQTDDIITEVSQESGQLNSVSALSIVFSIVKMFFWTFGDLPVWLDTIFVIFRLALVAILIQYLPFVG